MRQIRVVVVLVSAVAAASALVLAGVADTGAALAASRTVPAGTWGSAIEVPGLATLNAGGRAVVSSVSCGPAGTCAAGGSYLDRHQHLQGFVVSEQDGTWGNATWVPGLAALNAGGTAEVLSVSCGPAGTCAAGGYYYDRHGQQGFVVGEKSGTWGKVIKVPGLAALNAGGSATVSSVSCDPTGDCAAGGYYQDRRNHRQGFVVSEQNGAWAKAIEVPGLAALNTGGQALTTSLSCTSAGTCAAGGTYKSGHSQQGFVASEQNGRWSKAIELPGLATLSAGGATVSSVSCASAGNCTVGGGFKDHHGHGQGFVASQLNGTWGQALKVPGLSALNAGGSARILSLSCVQAGNCAAGGTYADSQHDQQGFVVSEQDGTWGNAIEPSGLASLNAGTAQISSVSCDSAGNCAAGGFYQDQQRKVRGLLVSQS